MIKTFGSPCFRRFLLAKNPRLFRKSAMLSKDLLAGEHAPFLGRRTCAGIDSVAQYLLRHGGHSNLSKVGHGSIHSLYVQIVLGEEFC